GVARGGLDARLAQAPLLPLELLRISSGAAHGGDEDDLAPARRLARGGDGRGEGGGGVGVRAVAQDHVEEDDGGGGGLGRGDDALVAKPGGEHGVRAAHGGLVVAQGDDGVVHAELGQDDGGVLGRRAAAVETVQELLASREAPGARPGRGGQRGDGGGPACALASSDGYRVLRGVLQRGGGGGARLADDRGIAAEKID